MKAFEQLRDDALRRGVAREENLPFFLRGDGSGRTGVLLVHGFTATPHEMRRLGDRLAADGHAVLAILLPGHGTKEEDLLPVTRHDWLQAVQDAYVLLGSEVREVSAVGISTGALLLTQLAARSNLRSLVAISPYLSFANRFAPLAGLLAPFHRFQKRELLPEERPFYYARRPLRGIAELNRLRKEVSALLPLVDCPLLVLSGEGDEVVAPGSSEKFFSRFGGANRRMVVFGPAAPHVLLGDHPQKEEVYRDICRFLNR